ncbi:MAG TPA: hypothetical protein VFN52_06340, partial [Acidiferrobacteraceae bacterium]|nr:hypothetical protein [Acidiferrobacteraceae bacterium]
YFQAMARLGVEGLLLVEPHDTSVNLGCFDDLAGIDLDHCRSRGWPVMRREAGGGTVLLAPGQVFYQLVLRRGRALTLGTIESVLRSLSRAPMEAYRLLGVETEYRPITDIVTREQRKISGQGAAEIDGYLCFVGSILMRFDAQAMSHVVRTHSAAHRNAVRDAMTRHLTWLDRELPAPSETATVIRALRDGFASLFDVLEERNLPRAVIAEAMRLAESGSSPEQLALDSPRSRRGIKIREGVRVERRTAEVSGEAHEAIVTVCEDRLEQVLLPGLQRPDVESALIGQRDESAAIAEALAALALAPALRTELQALLARKQ